MSQGFVAADSASSGGISGAYPVSASSDVVGVFDGFSQVFRDARPMKASVREEAKLMEHPVEDGSTVTDHMVVEAVEIELSMTLTPATYRETFKEIKDLFKQGKILNVQTKADSYANMVIQGLPHDEAPEIFDTVALSLKLKEITVVQAEFQAVYKAKAPAQGKTDDRGEVQPQEEKGSWASKNIGW